MGYPHAPPTHHTALTQTCAFRDDGQLVVVQFHAEWCKPCKATIPLVRKLARKHRKVIFGSYECDKSRPLLPKSVGITAFPAFIMYRAGEKIGMLKGSTCLGELMRIVENHDQP